MFSGRFPSKILRNYHYTGKGELFYPVFAREMALSSWRGRGEAAGTPVLPGSDFL